MKEISVQNIWGEEGCKLPGGNLCDCCCEFYQVTVADAQKPAYVLCTYQAKNNGGYGCQLHESAAKPFACVAFHCGILSAPEKMDLIAYAYMREIVTREEAIAALNQEHTKEFIHAIKIPGTVEDYLDKLVASVAFFMDLRQGKRTLD